MSMAHFIRFSFIIVLALAVAACGGGSGDKGDTAKKAKPKTDPRKGYFRQEQSDAINPLFAAYDKAVNTYFNDSEACNKEADRKFDAGATPRAAVACHFTHVNQYIKGIRDVRAGLQGIKGDYRKECTDELAAYIKNLDGYEKILLSQRAGWEAYASKGDTTKVTQANADALADNVTKLRDEWSPALAKACYIKADLEDAERAKAKPADDAAATDPDKTTG